MIFRRIPLHSVITLFLFCLGNMAQCLAVTSTEVFKRHANPVFIETGSYVGEGIDHALEAGFSEIYSIELSPYYHHFCCRKFFQYPNVRLIFGDSSVVLKVVLSNLQRRATFWLDGHYSAGNTALGNTHTPILQELAQIANHPIKTHTILIDDVRLFGTVEFDFIELHEIIDTIKQINANYHISFEDGYVPNDVLVAEVKE